MFIHMIMTNQWEASLMGMMMYRSRNMLTLVDVFFRRVKFITEDASLDDKVFQNATSKTVKSFCLLCMLMKYLMKNMMTVSSKYCSGRKQSRLVSLWDSPLKVNVKQYFDDSIDERNDSKRNDDDDDDDADNVLWFVNFISSTLMSSSDAYDDGVPYKECTNECCWW